MRPGSFQVFLGIVAMAFLVIAIRIQGGKEDSISQRRENDDRA